MRHKLLPYLVLISTMVWAQPPNSDKKYPSVFWEITGNHLKKPSYLFGTMHISSKLAFHLSDSFYVAIKNVDNIALELNPEDWQKDMYEYRSKQMDYYNYKGNSRSASSLSVFETTFKLKDFEKEITDILSYEPSTINNLLYRERQGETDFEEDTYLDLYIYQTGRKMGKKGLGVENYLESARLEEEGRVLQDKEKSKDRKSRMNSTNFYEELSDAYRKGDLDKLDSLEQLQMTSPAYWEKFLYERNVIQANNIDQILRHSSLFVGVGAAHLPGDRGVIELLRKKGYKLRPIFMKERDAEHKKIVDKIKVPVEFKTHTIFDGQITCQAPGTLYELDAYLNERKYLYSDMANGSYYLVTQFSTKSSLLHMSETELMKKLDNYLYEGIPGDIIEKKQISENGFKGFYIKNKTKKGDYQRYKIFVTPFDIFVFKIAGKQEYVNGHEGDKFINSVKINSLSHAGNKTFTPPHGGYSVKLKFHPQVFYDYYTGKSSLKYSDTVNGLHTIIEHYYSFNNDYLSDSSVLKLCEESLNRSPDFEKEVYRKIEETANGYTLDLIDSCKNKKYRSAKFVLSWPHIYVLVSVGGLKILNDNYVHDSFKITEFKSGEEALFVDTLAQFKVKTTSEITLDHHYMKLRKDMEALARDEHYVPYVKNHNEAFELKDPLSGYSVGIFVEQLSKYYYSSAPNFGIDTLEYTKGKRSPLVLKASGEAPSGHKYFYYTFNYYGSLITAHVKYIVTNEKIYVLKAYTLKGSELGPYCKKIFDTFEPHFNHKRNLNPFVKNTRVFWRDYFSANSKTFKTFQENLREQVYDLEDLDSLYKAYRRIGYKEEKYFKYKSDILEEISTVGNYRSNVNFQPANYLIDEYKNSYYSKGSNEDDENYLLERRSDMHFNKLIADEKAQNKKLELLVRMYKEAGDTLNLQRSVLEAISKLKTKEALHYVKNLLLEDPLITSNRYGESLAGIFNPMSDTLSLSKQLFPDIMQLTSISEEYKTEIIDLVEDLVKYQKIKPKELKKMHGLVFEATLQFKKQKLNDEKVLIAKNIVNREDVYSYNNKTDKFSLNTSLSDLLGTVAYLYKVDEKATKLVDKMLLSPNKVLKSELVAELLSKDKPVSDSIIVNLATDEYYSYTFYNKLRVRRLTHKFPHERTSQRKMTEIMLKNNLNVYDSIVFLDKQYVEIAGKTGYVYIYKYRIKRLDDWKLIVLGIQPKNLEQVNISEYLNEVYPKPLKHDSQSSSFSSEILHKKKIMTLKAGFYNDKEGYSHGGFNYVDYED